MLKTAWQFRRFLRPHLGAFVLGAVFVIGETMADLAQPWPLKVIIDGVIDHKDQHGWFAKAVAGGSRNSHQILNRAIVATVVLVSLSALFDLLSGLLLNRAGERSVAHIRASLFGHLQRLSISFHDRQRVGDLVGRLTTDIDRTQTMLVAIFDTFIPNLVMLIGLAIVMVLVDPGFGLLALTIAPPLFFVTYRYTLRIKRASLRAREADAGLATMANETLGAVRSVQAFSREDIEDRRFGERNKASVDAELTAIRLKSTFTPLIDVVSLGGTVLVTFVGVHRVLEGRMTVGLLLVFLSYQKSLYKPMRALSKLAYVISQGTTSARRVDEMLTTDLRIPEFAHARPAPPLRGRVELRNVAFHYPNSDAPVLANASMIVEPGEHIGLVGRTGAGKSTLVSMIPRFHDPDAGTVLIDGIDIRDLELESLRRQVSLVLQDPVLFYGSILDNIRYAEPDASIERVLEVARAAHVSEFVDRLPNGFDTLVGERGVTLSGGQRQRIAVARAMLREAPILILDEPTTGLDRESEAFLLDGLERLSAGRTTFIISHHESSLERVDRIFEVDRGWLRERPVPGRCAAHLWAPPLANASPAAFELFLR